MHSRNELTGGQVSGFRSHRLAVGYTMEAKTYYAHASHAGMVRRAEDCGVGLIHVL